MNPQDAPAQQVLTLPGAVALSPFRVDKLVASLPPRAAKPAIDTRFVHFAAIAEPLDASETQVLERLLTYGTPARGEPQGKLLLVLPRFGTVSPWSSKATDIARNCGLAKVIRIERGVAYYVTERDPALEAAIHDRMTETVVADLGEAQKLFTHAKPQPLATVDVLGSGRSALDAANESMGLALAPDEKDGAICVALGDDRFVALVPAKAAPAMWDLMSSAEARAGAEDWEWTSIRAGIPTIVAATQEAFVPQMANFDLVGGVSFTKGCYPGQEIVARTQYRGGLKRRMALAHLAGGDRPAPGEKVYSPSFGDQSAGTIVNAARAPDGGFDALVVAQLESLARGDLHLGSPDGPRLEIRSQPPVPAA